MNTSRSIGLPGISVILLLSACFHKSDTTGTADDIKHSLICKTSTGVYLITHEEVFHATSKSSGPKGTFTSGYADYRYTIRNIQTGEQINRLITGERDEDLVPLGYDGKQLWCYGADKKTGLHARDASNMQVTIERGQIEKANPFLRGTLTTPKVYEAEQFYAYDILSNTVMLTDIQGNLYLLNSASLKAQPIKEKPPMPGAFSHAHASSANRWADMRISLSGELRKQIDLKGNKKSETSYLKGEILLEQNGNRLSSVASQILQAGDAELRILQQRCDSILRLYPVLKDERQAYLTIRDANIPSRYYEMYGELERKVRDSLGNVKSIINELDNMVLGCDSNQVYILHANNLTDTSSILVSRVTIRDGSAINEWTTLMPNIYFDPSKGIKRNSMSEVFKSGSPEFRYEWFGLEGNVLVGIKMLFAFGIDVQTGKLLWKQQL